MNGPGEAHISRGRRTFGGRRSGKKAIG